MFVKNCHVDTAELLKQPLQKKKNSKKQKKSDTEDDDNFHPVKCTECTTVVGVCDTDEVYHFFNVLASHTWIKQHSYFLLIFYDKPFSRMCWKIIVLSLILTPPTPPKKMVYSAFSKRKKMCIASENVKYIKEKLLWKKNYVEEPIEILRKKSSLQYPTDLLCCYGVWDIGKWNNVRPNLFLYVSPILNVFFPLNSIWISSWVFSNIFYLVITFTGQESFSLKLMQEKALDLVCFI